MESGVCQETILLDSDVGLNRLPIPTWTPGKDIGPYITTPVITSNAHTGRQNVGIDRTRVRDAIVSLQSQPGPARLSQHLYLDRPGLARTHRLDYWRPSGRPIRGDREFAVG